MKKHTTTYWGEHAPEAYLSNGLLGFRYGKNPFDNVSGFLAGFNYANEYGEVEAPAAIPTPRLEFYYRSEKIEPETLSQSYDFSCGELCTEAVLRHWIKGIHEEVRLKYTVFCSRTSPTLLISKLETSGTMMENLKVVISYAPAEKWKHSLGEVKYFDAEKGQDGKCLFWSSDRMSCAGAALKLFGDIAEKRLNETMSPYVMLNVRENASLDIVTSYIPEIMHVQPHNQAQRMVKISEWYGIDLLRQQNKEEWAKLWESRITVDGATEEWQDVIDASFFYLMSSMSAFTPMSIAPFGLSYPELYYGHVFWDTESFMFLTPLFIAPDIAKNMLDYRFKRIDAAKNHAKINGCVGIQFPWESGISGSEMIATRSVHAGEHHVNLDIALAFDAYARMHPDEYFLKEMAWPVIYGVCEWLESRVEKTERGYELRHTTGPDEAQPNVNNDAYTNRLSAKLLKIGAEYSERLGYGKRVLWLDIADNLFVNVREDGVILQHDTQIENVETLPSVAMTYFPYACFDEEHPENDIKNMEYCISCDMEYHCTLPMLSGFLGVFPAWVGNRKKSKEFYNISSLTFFTKPFFACTEFRLSEEDREDFTCGNIPTHFLTNRGSLLAGLIMGLTKFCPWNAPVGTSAEEWAREDIILPEGWNKITVGKIYVQGKAYRLEAEHGAKRAKLIEL